jgi:hypothetical protein
MKTKTTIFALFTLFIFGLTSCEKEEINDSVNPTQINEETLSADKGQNLPPGSAGSDDDEDYN